MLIFLGGLIPVETDNVLQPQLGVHQAVDLDLGYGHAVRLDDSAEMGLGSRDFFRQKGLQSIGNGNPPFQIKVKCLHQSEKMFRV